MAKKPKTAKTRKRLPIDPVTAALELAATQGWAHTTLNDIASRANISLAELHERFPTKAAILAEFAARIDGKMLQEAASEEADEPARDRLFATIMRRFDLLAPHKEAIRAIFRDLSRDPAALLCALGPAQSSAVWMLEAAGLNSSGVKGLARRTGLGLIYSDILRTWLRDDSVDFAKTMSALDRRLRQAETIWGYWPGPRHTDQPSR
jgi:AcrR family transcriptional regulator